MYTYLYIYKFYLPAAQIGQGTSRQTVPFDTQATLSNRVLGGSPVC